MARCLHRPHLPRPALQQQCELQPAFRRREEKIGGGGKKNRDSRAQVLAFQDTWRWDARAAQRGGAIKKAVGHRAQRAIVGLEALLGASGMLAYTSYMAERLTECWRLLKDSGSLFLHCDPTAGHYLKILLDVIFGSASFRNEIVWCYTGPANIKRWFPRKHDTIFFFAKDNAKFNKDDIRIPYSALTSGGSGGGAIFPEGHDEARMEELRQLGKVPEDWWVDIHPLTRRNNERLGYPTQKPVALLERILRAASDEGDLVLDPFCGCGTTIDAAQRLNRRWLGIDISPFAIDLIRERRLPELEIPTHGIPMDLASAERLAQEKPFDFEKWAVTRIEGLLPNERQVGDGGIDGRGQLLNPTAEMEPGLVLAQVKGGGFSQNDLRAFKGVMADEGAAFGVFITLTRLRKKQRRKAQAFAARSGEHQQGANTYPRLQLWSIEDHFAGRHPILPTLADPYTGKAKQRTLRMPLRD